MIRSSSKGYTLIELLAGISIMGIVFGVGLVGYREFSRRQELDGALKKLRSAVQETQQLALNGEKPDNVFCNNPNRLIDYRITFNLPVSYTISANCTGGAVVTTMATLSESDDITLTRPSPNPIAFKILGAGTNIASGGTAVISLSQLSTGKNISLTIDYSGNIK